METEEKGTESTRAQAHDDAPGISKLTGRRTKDVSVSRGEWGLRCESRTFSKPNCFWSAMEIVVWRVSWATEEDVGVCCGVANDIHLAAFPIAMVGGVVGVSEETQITRT